MRREAVKQIVLYYKSIPGMLKSLRQERGELENEYNGMGGIAMDGMPHGSAPGKPTETLAERVIENGVEARLQEIAVKMAVLEGDSVTIRGCLDALNGKYKRVIFLRNINGYSWARLSAQMGVPDSTARYWHSKAMGRLSEALDDVPMPDELAGRASRART